MLAYAHAPADQLAAKIVAMSKKHLLILSLVAACAAAQAQAADGTPAAPKAGEAKSSEAKKQLIAQILKYQQPGIENLARSLAERPAAELMANAGQALSARVAADKRESVAKEIQADVRKYVDEAVPLVRDQALKLAPTTVGPMLEEKFSEDELRQIVAMMQSPVFNKFQAMGGDMQRALVEKLVVQTRDAINPKVRAMEESVAKRLGMTPQPTQKQVKQKKSEK